MSFTQREARNLIRKAVSRVPEGEEVRHLNIMPMMDMMTILLVAFIFQMATSALELTAGTVELPRTSTGAPLPEKAWTLVITPTGIVVACQTERSQHKNRATAMKMLKAKLYELEVNKRNAAAKVLEDSKSDVSWGNQIRSYVLDQSRIKDLRTNVEVGTTDKVLDGDLDQFMEASLKAGL